MHNYSVSKWFIMVHNGDTWLWVTQLSLLDLLPSLWGSEAQENTIGAYNSASTLKAAEAERRLLTSENTEAPVCSHLKYPCEAVHVQCWKWCPCVLRGATKCACVRASMFVPCKACGDLRVTPHNRHRYYTARISPEQRLSSSFCFLFSYIEQKTRSLNQGQTFSS